jgi:hypothetical protein
MTVDHDPPLVVRRRFALHPLTPNPAVTRSFPPGTVAALECRPFPTPRLEALRARIGAVFDGAAFARAHDLDVAP